LISFVNQSLEFLEEVDLWVWPFHCLIKHSSAKSFTTPRRTDQNIGHIAKERYEEYEQIFSESCGQSNCFELFLFQKLIEHQCFLIDYLFDIVMEVSRLILIQSYMHCVSLIGLHPLLSLFVEVQTKLFTFFIGVVTTYVSIKHLQLQGIHWSFIPFIIKQQHPVNCQLTSHISQRHWSIWLVSSCKILTLKDNLGDVFFESRVHVGICAIFCKFLIGNHLTDNL
jgi:hypothetical protein